MRIILAIIAFGLFCASVSYSIGIVFNNTVQWAILPLFIIGGFFFGRFLAEKY